MCFDLDSDAADPARSPARPSRTTTRPDRGRRQPVRRVPATPDEPAATGVVILPDVRGPLPLLRGARAAVRRARERRDRVRLLRPHRRRGEARRRLRVHAARRADDRRRRAGRRPGRGRAAARGAAPTSVFTRRLLLRRPCVVGRRRLGSRARRLRSASTARRRGERGGPSVVAARVERSTCPILALQAGDDQGITADDNAAFEQALTRRRRRARDRHLRRRAAQLLRSQAGRVRRGVRRRLAAHARVRRARDA